MVGGQSPLGSEVLAILGDQNEAGIRAVVDSLRPCVTDAIGEMTGEALVDVDQQTVVLRIPTRSCLKVNRDRKGAHARRKGARRNGGAINVLQSAAALRVMDGHLGGRIRLVHIIETAEMDAANVQTADAHRRIGERIEFNRSAGLNVVKVPEISIQPNHNGRSKECTFSDRSTSRERVRERISCIVRISSIFDQTLEPETGDRRGAGEGEEFCLGVDIVLERPPRIFADCSAARWNLAGEERRRNNSMEQGDAGSNDHITLRPKTLSKS